MSNQGNSKLLNIEIRILQIDPFDKYILKNYFTCQSDDGKSRSILIGCRSLYQVSTNKGIVPKMPLIIINDPKK